MLSRSSADTPLLLAGLGLLVAAAVLPFTVLHLSTSSHDLGGAPPAVLLAAPCPVPEGHRRPGRLAAPVTCGACRLRSRSGVVAHPHESSQCTQAT